MKKIKENPKLIHNKNFILLFAGGLVSRIGDGIHYIALVWLVLELTGSGTATGILLLLTTLPGVLIGPFSGVIADRVNRKILIVGMDFLRGLITIWLGLIVLSGNADFVHLAIATVFIAMCSAFFNPAISATLPNLVDDSNLQRATSLDHFSMNVTQVIGAAVGGLLIAFIGVAGVFILNGVSFIISAISELFIEIPKIKRDNNAKVSIISDLKVGANYIFQNKDILYLFVIALFLNLVGTGTLMVGLPFSFKEILKVNSKLFGIAQSIFPAGAIIGALFLSFYGEIKNYYRLLISTFGLESILMVLLGVPLLPGIINYYNISYIYWSLISIVFVFGVVNAILNVPIKVLLQRLIPDNLRGRVFGLLGTLSQSLVPISFSLAGFLLDIIPAYFLFIISGILSFALTIYSTRVPALRNLGKEKKVHGSPKISSSKL